MIKHVFRPRPPNEYMRTSCNARSSQVKAADTDRESARKQVEQSIYLLKERDATIGDMRDLLEVAFPDELPAVVTRKHKPIPPELRGEMEEAEDSEAAEAEPKPAVAEAKAAKTSHGKGARKPQSKPQSKLAKPSASAASAGSLGTPGHWRS